MTGTNRVRPILRVYVAPGCASYRTARKIVEAVRQARPAHPVEVIDLADHPEALLPAGVVGTPTYLLGGEVISMGNPEFAELLGELDSVAPRVEDE